MKLYFRKYQNDKIVNLLKKDSFLLFSINANRSSDNWLTLEQNINKLAITYTKTYNNAVRKTFEKSIFKNLKNLIGGTFFFSKTKKNSKNENRKRRSKLIKRNSIYYNSYKIKQKTIYNTSN